MIMLVTSESLYRTPSTMTPLQEILPSSTASSRYCTAMIGHGTEDLELLLEVFAEVHDGSDVPAAVAVVGCRPYRDDVLVFEVVLKHVSV